MLQAKTTDIVDTVSTTMESMLKTSEANLMSKLSFDINKSLDERMTGIYKPRWLR